MATESLKIISTKGVKKKDKENREKYEGKPLREHFIKAAAEVRAQRSWGWLKMGSLKKETECAIVAAKDQVLCTKNLRNVVYGENV